MNIEDLECFNSCGKPLLGHVIALIPDQDYHEDEIDTTPRILHHQCFIDVMDEFFKQEKRAGFNIVVAPVFDLWAGLFTDDDNEAGIPEG